MSRWQKLATPNLAGVLEHRPGIQVKGQHLAKCFEEEKYSIGDYEEDGICPLIIPLLSKVYSLFGRCNVLTHIYLLVSRTSKKLWTDFHEIPETVDHRRVD